MRRSVRGPVRRPVSTRHQGQCRRTRAALQESMDRHAPVPVEVGAHLADCAECRRFQAGLARLGREIGDAVAPPQRRSRDPAEGLAMLSNARATAPRRLAWLRPAWTAAAAAVILTVAIAGGIRVRSTRVERAETAEEMGAFVVSLYNQSALDGVEYSPVSFLDDVQSLPDWLSQQVR